MDPKAERIVLHNYKTYKICTRKDILKFKLYFMIIISILILIYGTVGLRFTFTL